MRKYIKSLVVLLCLSTGVFAQKINYKKSDKGVRYSIVKANKGERIKLDDNCFFTNKIYN